VQEKRDWETYIFMDVPHLSHVLNGSTAIDWTVNWYKDWQEGDRKLRMDEKGSEK